MYLLTTSHLSTPHWALRYRAGLTVRRFPSLRGTRNHDILRFVFFPYALDFFLVGSLRSMSASQRIQGQVLEM